LTDVISPRHLAADFEKSKVDLFFWPLSCFHLLLRKEWNRCKNAGLGWLSMVGVRKKKFMGRTIDLPSFVSKSANRKLKMCFIFIFIIYSFQIHE
jgi:hypothetical protein